MGGSTNTVDVLTKFLSAQTLSIFCDVCPSHSNNHCSTVVVVRACETHGQLVERTAASCLREPCTGAFLLPGDATQVAVGRSTG